MKYLSPHQRVRRVEHLVSDLLAAVRGQTVQQHRTLFRVRHERPVNSVRAQRLASFYGLTLGTHGDPRVGVDRVRVLDRVIGRIGEAQRSPGPHQQRVFHALGPQLVVVRRANRDVDAQSQQRHGQRTRHVGGVAHVGHVEPRQCAHVAVGKVFGQGQHVGDGLRRVRLVTQQIDEREAVVCRGANTRKNAVVAHAQGSNGVHLGQGAPNILDALAAVEANLLIAEKSCVAAQFVHRGGT